MAELKHIVNYKRQVAIYKWMANIANKDYLMQTIKAKTIRVPASECNEFPTNCYIVRTECNIPTPYRDPRSKRPYEMFEYVGDISGYLPYGYAQRESLSLLRYKPYTSSSKKWFYSDKYVYIVNDKSVEEGSVMIRGVFSDPLSDYGCDVCDSSGNVCAPDDAPYPVPPELLDEIVMSILSVELRSGDLPKDFTLNKDQIKVDSVEAINHNNI
jgi:hypothetical protein